MHHMYPHVHANSLPYHCVQVRCWTFFSTSLLAFAYWTWGGEETEPCFKILFRHIPMLWRRGSYSKLKPYVKIKGSARYFVEQEHCAYHQASSFTVCDKPGALILNSLNHMHITQNEGTVQLRQSAKIWAHDSGKEVFQHSSIQINVSGAHSFSRRIYMLIYLSPPVTPKFPIPQFSD